MFISGNRRFSLNQSLPLELHIFPIIETLKNSQEYPLLKDKLEILGLDEN